MATWLPAMDRWKRHAASDVAWLATLVQRAFALAVTGIVLLLIARRVSGVDFQPLAPTEYFAFGCALSTAAYAVRSAVARNWLSLSPMAAALVGLAVAVAGALSILPPSGISLAALAVASPLLVEEGWAFWTLFRTPQVKAAVAPSPNRQLGEGDLSGIVEEISETEDTALHDPSVVQHLVRRRESAGEELIFGFLRADFLPGQRTVNVHVPFCPPLLAAPECRAEVVDASSARVRVVQVLPQGARLEVKLASPALEPQQVVVEFSTV